MNLKHWTEEDDNYIKNNYGHISLTEMSNTLNCTIETLKKRAGALGLEVTTKEKRRWTKEEEELLREYSKKYVIKTIAKKLNRSCIAVDHKAQKLGIKLRTERDPWKKWMIDYLKDNINTKSARQISIDINMNEYQVMNKIKELNLPYDNRRWTEEEIKILTDLSDKCYIKEIAKVLNRTEAAVVSKAHHLKLEVINIQKEYTEEELDYIRNNWGIIPVTEIARNLKVSRQMVQTQADKMNLKKLGNNPYKRWTKNEIDKLRELSKKYTRTELAKKFKVSNDCISKVASKNNIQLIDDKIHWTEEEKEYLSYNASNMTVEELARKMNKATSAIRLQLIRQNLKAKKDNNRRLWTDDEIEKLKELISQNKSLIQIVKELNRRDVTILKKATELNLKIIRDEEKGWTEEAINKLIELSKSKKLGELVIELGKSSKSIKDKAKSLGITIILNRKSWSQEDINELTKLINEGKLTTKEIADKLGRTEDAITIKVNRLGLKIQTNDKRYWTKEEEILLSDLWGNKSIDKIAKKLNRTVSSVKNKVYQLGLGSQIENNYEGIRFNDLCDIFGISIEKVSIYWVSLGLKYKTRNISKTVSYRYVEIDDLYEFLEKNQNIWDSRLLTENIFGIEPDWLKEKRKNDKDKPDDYFKLANLTKQQLIIAKKYFLSHGINSNDITKDNDTDTTIQYKKHHEGDDV